MTNGEAIIAAQQAEIASLRAHLASVREALEGAAQRFEAIRLLLIKHLEEPERSAFWVAVNAKADVRAALASLPAPEAAPTREEYAAVLAQELWCGATFADATPSEREAFLRAVDAILALKAAPAK